MKTLIMLTIFLSFSAQANFKAAYIDMQSAIQATSAGRKAKSKLEKEFNKKKDQLKKKETSLKKRAKEFEKKMMVLSEKKRIEQQTELQKEMMAFQKELGESQVSIQKKEREMTKPILIKLQKIIAQVAKEKGYSMIFEKSEHSVMWAKTDLDITDMVVKKFEKTK